MTSAVVSVNIISILLGGGGGPVCVCIGEVKYDCIIVQEIRIINYNNTIIIITDELTLLLTEYNLKVHTHFKVPNGHT